MKMWILPILIALSAAHSLAAEKQAERKVASQTARCTVADRHTNSGDTIRLNDFSDYSQEKLDGCPVRIVRRVVTPYSDGNGGRVNKNLIYTLAITTLNGTDKDKCRYTGPSAADFPNQGRVDMDTIDCEINE